jgi:hypothetical protein
MTEQQASHCTFVDRGASSNTLPNTLTSFWAGELSSGLEI